MIKRTLLLLSIVFVFTGLAGAETITSIQVITGPTASLNPNYFAGGDDGVWNTTNSVNWAVPVTTSGGNTVLDSFQNVNLATGTDYWLYMANNGTTSPYLEVILGYADATSTTELFEAPAGGNVENNGFTLQSTSGSGAPFSLGLVNPPSASYQYAGQGYNAYYPGDNSGSADWVLSLNSSSPVPEPPTLILAGLGMLGMFFVMRRKFAGQY